MEEFLTTETAIVGVLVIVSVVAIAVRRIKLPYTVALVVAGWCSAIRGSLEIGTDARIGFGAICAAPRL